MSDPTPDQAEVQAVLLQLASSVALLPQDVLEGEEPPPAGAIALPVIEQDGTQYVPIFSSHETLAAAGADPTAALEVPIAQLAAAWPDDDLWLAVDPATAQGLTLPPDVVRSLPGLVGVGPN